ncbi:MAG TPA: formate dehydrogenase accessory sulfurtransferase FdhD [Methylophilaceae bacterium]|jgi:FdhD protein
MFRAAADADSALAVCSEYPVIRWENGQTRALEDHVAEEMPVALVYNGISHAVMLATPQDLEDFAFGFSLTEGIIGRPQDIYDIETFPRIDGVELRITLASEQFQMLKLRRRSMTGRTGCGLCGAESLEQAMRIPTNVMPLGTRIPASSLEKAIEEIGRQQQLQLLTGGTHACAWIDNDGSIKLLREDVGRHNALDKLIGAIARSGAGADGFVLTTSRASYEMVQKTASAGIPLLAAMSAATGLAIRVAQGCGMTLIGFARHRKHVIYSCPERVLHEEAT